MEPLLNAEQMKQCDKSAIEKLGISSLVLMERAALAVVEEMEAAQLDLTRVLVICGSGNNGGDGFAIARLLAERMEIGVYGHMRRKKTGQVTLAFVGREDSATKETALQRQICENCGIKICSNFMEAEYTVIVDAMLGIGLSRPVAGRYAEIIGWINRQAAQVVAVDIPSGVSADSGAVLGVAVKADLTVTVASRKIGQILYPGAKYCGRLVCRKIGIPVSCRPLTFTYSEEDLARLPVRDVRSNKGTCGKILLIAGSEGMSGAACLAARAAYRTGSGMVRVLTPECNRAVIQSCLPEALVTTWKPGEPEKTLSGLLDGLLAWADAVGIGPGLSKSADALILLRYVLQHCEKAVVLDADALNLLSENLELLKDMHGQTVMTPHPGEMMRLTGKGQKSILDDLIGTASVFARERKAVLALKDARTVVSDGERAYVNTSGNQGMATAGSGDVLTGIICSLLGQGLSPFDAAALGVYIHGCAGDLAREACGAYGMLAGDITEQIGNVLKRAEQIQGDTDEKA